MLYGIEDIFGPVSTINGPTYQPRIKKCFESRAGADMRIVETVYILVLLLQSGMQYRLQVDLAMQ